MYQDRTPQFACISLKKKNTKLVRVSLQVKCRRKLIRLQLCWRHRADIFFTVRVGRVDRPINFDKSRSITKTCPCNIQRFSSALQIENFFGKIFDIFNIFALNIDCGYALEYPQSMFWIKSNKNRYTPACPSFAI